ncbi:Xaa-Pro dipeptidyl-peptidase [Prauserella marina]|uniref:Xaa-Pro dipeptidyl-peptidase n=1 Tax=Prauserella marina TaxID=530584 RepID=A0A222VU70_9PSEU|nr:Xaa-Pro dipeptidyl-peptidase [Prauserella marina]ASR37477.1 Xaa-Pro dipeptidyl-peptidase [Prauserella marina]PWV74632.1 X-Pro dipeptidyl-peptidase [Prauserella marina]SDD44795.1 X-Pro dipeptidyl-peptidase [Prauserella marina]
MRSARLPRIVVAALGAVVIAVPLAPAAAAEPPQGPVFEDGQAQPVFDPQDVVRESLWVSAPVDSDRDGADDEVHIEIVRPTATEQGLRVPVVYQASPYFAGGNPVVNHDVDVELYVPGKPGKPMPQITWRYEEYLLARGFAVVYAESLGSGLSTGCPTTGGTNETVGARSVVDWLNGRASARDADGAPVSADWTTGKTAMTGVSYNGTLPNAVASTGVEGLETIVPIAAISDWYDYYRENGAVVAPGGYQGEDADVLAEYVYTRADKEICKPVIEELAARQDRVTGDYNAFWDERNYLDDAGKVRASVLAVHGLSDWNVTTSQVAAWYEALGEHGVERKIWLHQSGHTDPLSLRRDEWLATFNRWISHYLYDVDNGVEREPRATIQREDESWTEEADWPAPGTRDVDVHPRPGGAERGGLDVKTALRGKPVVERLTDDSGKTVEELVDLAASGNRLAYATPAARQPVRLSGTPVVDVRIAVDRPAANVTGVLVDRAPDGTSRVITRGWADPQNRKGDHRTDRIRPGVSYDLSFGLQPQDYVLERGHVLEFVLLSSDHDFTLRPKPGTGLAMTLNKTTVSLPVVGGKASLRAAF